MDANTLSNALLWAGLVGFLTPVVYQFLTRVIASRRLQAVGAFVFCLLVAVPTAIWAPGSNFTLHDYAREALIVFTLAVSSYEHFWKPAGVTPANATTP